MRSNTSNKVPYLLALIPLLGFFILYSCYFCGGFSEMNSDWGSFGSYIGGTMGPIVGIISIVLTYKIIIHQLKDSEQSEFRFMFSKYFDSLEDKIELLEIEKGNISYKGKAALRILNIDFASVIIHLKTSQQAAGGSIDYMKIAMNAFDSVNSDYNGVFSPCMKNLHNCLKVIEFFCDKNSEKIYANIVRSQLGTEEMKFLLYNGLAFPGFKKRIEMYSMLQDIKNTNEVDKEIKNLYVAIAYA